MGNRNIAGFVRIALVALAAVAVWFLSYYTSQPHKQNYAAKSATEFSALRADATLGRILGPEIPDPVSSEAATAVRGRIQAEFAALGVPTRAYTAFTCNAWRGFVFVACATVTNIVADAVPGQGKAIVLLAHYDSVPAGPGASDDKSGVVTVLETIRALKAQGGVSLHPVIAVITDGEEAGLLGANAFLQNKALKDRVGVVINVEARGTRGASLLFQTSPGDGRLIDLYAHNAPVMATSSLYAEIYKFLPNDTDLTLFIDAGFPSYNFAFTDNVKYYHSPFDLRHNLSHATLQMHGDNMLSVASALEHTDYAALKGGNDVYLSILGQILPRMAGSLALPFAVLVFLAIAIAVWMYVAVLVARCARRRVHAARIDRGLHGGGLCRRGHRAGSVRLSRSVLCPSAGDAVGAGLRRVRDDAAGLADDERARCGGVGVAVDGGAGRGDRGAAAGDQPVFHLPVFRGRDSAAGDGTQRMGQRRRAHRDNGERIRRADRLDRAGVFGRDADGFAPA
jgi:hypothetical protein